ncbi:MAG: cysteine desulfurase [Clostridia bacterium]|nr:cysteine desulfurase [Clostridia bacterium]
MKEIYLDYAATTRPLQEVAEAVAVSMINTYGNPSSLHKKGVEAETILKETSDKLSKMLGCLADEIIYTSGGTESNNMAILGLCAAYKRRAHKLITSSVEHPSVLETFKYLQTQGFEVCIIGVDKEGMLDLEALQKAIDKETLLVSIMHVNNEIGTVQDIERIGGLIKQKNKDTFFHVDAVQSFGKAPISVKKCNIDLLSISAHKFYGPRGVGVLYKNKDVRINPLIYGGGQQKGIRAGTENVPGIAGMLKACNYADQNMERLNAHYRTCKMYLSDSVLEHIPDTFINGPDKSKGAPHILNIGFRGIKSEVLLHALESKGIYVSSGSACSSNKKVKSTVLSAIGNKKEDLDNAIRFSFGMDTSLEELSYVADKLEEQVMLLRKYTLGGRHK